MNLFAWIRINRCVAGFALISFLLLYCPTLHPETKEDLIWRCRSCRLTLLDQEIVEGRLVDVRSDSLDIEYTVILGDWDPFTSKVREFHRRTVSIGEISSVRCGDPVLNGIIWGAVIAALPTFIISNGATSGDGDPANRQVNWEIVAKSTAIAGGIGALLGYLIDRVDGPRYDPDVEILRRAGRE
jgi:hypothetical protein